MINMFSFPTFYTVYVQLLFPFTWYVGVRAAIARARAAAGGRRLRHAVADLRALPEEDPKPRLCGYLIITTSRRDLTIDDG